MKTTIISLNNVERTVMMIEEPSFTMEEYIKALYDWLERSEEDENLYGFYLRSSQIGQLIAKLEEVC